MPSALEMSRSVAVSASLTTTKAKKRPLHGSFCDLLADLVEPGGLALDDAQALDCTQGFPAGVRLGPNTRAWPEDQVLEWVASRPAVK